MVTLVKNIKVKDNIIMEMTPELNLLLQLPLAGLVVFLVIRFLAHLKDVQISSENTLKEVSKNSNDAIEKTTKLYLEFIESQSTINREFLKTQRQQFSDSIARMAEELKVININATKEHSAILDALEKLGEQIEG